MGSTDQDQDTQRWTAGGDGLATLADNIPDVIFRIDREFRHLYVNRAIEEITGIRPEKYVGKTNRDLGMADDNCLLWESRFAEAFTTKKVVEFDFEFESPQSGTRHFHTRLIPEVSREGVVNTILGVANDVTQYKAALQELQRRQEILSLIHQIARIGHYEWDSITDRNNWSPEIQALYGVKPGTFEGNYAAWANRVHPDDLPKAEEEVRKALETGKFFTEFRVVWPDGSIRWLEARANVLHDSRDKSVRFIGVNMDVTDRKRQEEALRNSEQSERKHAAEWAALLDSTPMPVFIAHDQDCLHLSGNRAADELLRNPRGSEASLSAPEESKPRHFKAFKDGRELASHELPAQRGARGERVRNFEFSLVFDDGTTRQVVGNSEPLFDDQGRPRGAVHVLTDITDRKRAEDALKEADRRKDRFIATLAHELRNPLAPIRNAVQVLKASGLTERNLKLSRDVIERQVQQMARLLDDLLDVSRISHNRLELRKQRVTLASVIQNAVETSRPLIASHGHELSVLMPDHEVHLDADPLRLAQVFANLLNNAAKYTKRNGNIRLSAEQVDRTVVVSVNDNGMGISHKMLPHLFEMFSQDRMLLEHSQGGLGIGLSLVKALVEMHGGTVGAHSDGPDMGSEFVVRLPAALAEAPQQPPDRHSDTPHVTRYKIVVADDNQDSAETLAMMLTVSGHDVRTAFDGQEAVKLCEAFRPDVVMLDIGMPLLNGHDTCRFLRQQSWGRNILVVALSGWGQEEDRRQSQEAGFDTHMVKPVDPNALQTLLASWRK